VRALYPGIEGVRDFFVHKMFFSSNKEVQLYLNIFFLKIIEDAFFCHPEEIPHFSTSLRTMETLRMKYVYVNQIYFSAKFLILFNSTDIAEPRVD